ncbi:MAG: hypothetical protein K2X03_17195 [Bryobacteraceae bacterium]|nr:hypothetical protein [Bryobacteraceae bacterium]
MTWLILSLLLAQSPKPRAAKPVAKPTGDPGPTVNQVRSLAVQGNRNFTAAGILEFSGVRVGQSADAAAFEAARVKLANSGVFERVGYKYSPATGGGVDAVFEVVEIPQVFPYRFEDLPASPAEMTAYLKQSDPLFAERIPATKEFLSRYSRALDTFLQTKGVKEAVVSKLVPDVGDKLVVIFRPDRPLPTIAQVGFQGNEAVPTPALQIAMNQIAMGAVYKEDMVRQYLETTIRPIYEQRGRLEVTFPKVSAQPSKDNGGMNVMVEVVEGPSFDIGEIRLRGPIQDPKPLYQTMVLQPGDLANMTEVAAATRRVKAYLVREGYLKAEAKFERKLRREKDKPLADIVVNVAPGAAYTFGKLKIEGLDILNEPQLRKLWSLETGKAYNGEYAELFLNRIRDDGLFENLGSTKAIPVVNEQSRVVDVTLVFGAAAKMPPKKRPF